MVIYNNRGWPNTFEGVHMSLIPKGPYQGMVLVWDIAPVVAKDPPGMPPLSANQWRSFQGYSIIDLADTPQIATPNDPAVRYRNFLLPMDPPVILPGNTTDLFCSGHTWSQFGDLIVLGGTSFTPAPGTVALGARFTYAWNPDRLIGSYPGSLTYFPYPGFGLWVPGPSLAKDRWYPTALLTHPLQRTFGGTPPREREVVLVIGGSEIDPATTGPGVFQSTWNSFESLVVDARATPGNSGLLPDSFVPGGSTGNAIVWPGPGTALAGQEWFEEYPRVHLLSTGRVFFSGYAPRWARMDPENPGSWQNQPGVGPFSSNWDRPRHDGASLLFPNLGNQHDRVLRLGGGDNHFYFPSTFGTTETVESITAGATNPTWQSEPSLPISPAGSTTPPSRQFLNAVTLPNADILVVGGVHRIPGGGFVGSQSASLFSGGVFTPLPPPGSVRAYHATAVLLDDGRVFVGGGFLRTFDYEIFSPRYVTDPVLSAQRPTNVVFQTPPFFDPQFDAFQLSYNGLFTVACNPLPTGVVLERAVLMAPGSTTHHSDMSQRYIELRLLNEEATPNQLTVQAPPSSKHAPRGIYMLFLVTNTGAVSRKAVWVFLP